MEKERKRLRKRNRRMISYCSLSIGNVEDKEMNMKRERAMIGSEQRDGKG